MNTSQGGGVCDCGDVEAWKDGHACEVHQQGQDEDMDEVQHACTSYTIIDRASDISRKKNQNFVGFSGANSWKNRPISWDFSGKIQISKDFQGQILRKIGRFHGKFRGETSPRNNQ